MDKINKHFPERARKLLNSKGRELITEIGLEIVKGIVFDVLCGKNLRDSTELLTRKRISALNVAEIVTYVRGEKGEKGFLKNITKTSAGVLVKKGLTKANRWVLEWKLGLTDKAFQNVLRDDNAGLNHYQGKFVEIQTGVAEESERQYGALTGSIQIGENKIELSWPVLLQMLASTGAQTLAIRGSEKPTYGKLFERLILGSLLQALGFTLIDKKDYIDQEKVFWLSSKEDKRESDATLIIGSSKGVKFDIGFIGKGNPEISLDKVTRFEREIVLGKRKISLVTIIIIDRIGKKSSLERQAKRIKGEIVQMSQKYWPLQLAQILFKTTGYKSAILDMSEEDANKFLKKKIQSIDFEKIIKIPETKRNPRPKKKS